jgi:hypothetical protein
VHNAMKSLSSADAAKVNSGTYTILLPTAHILSTYIVLIFGDPLNGTAVANISPSKVKVICHSGDNICMQGDQILQAHLTVSYS